MKAEASVVVRMPGGLTLPSAGSSMEIQSSDSSTPATSGTVLPGNLVQIENFVPAN